MKKKPSQNKKCTCGRGNKLYCATCSKVKMVICLKNGQDHLKKQDAQGNQYNPVWYSFLRYQNHDIYRIATKMITNFEKRDDLRNATNVLLFYINGNEHQEFHRVNL